MVLDATVTTVTLSVMNLQDRVTTVITELNDTDTVPVRTVLDMFTEEGYSEHAIRMSLTRAVQAGDLVRVDRGVYKAADAPTPTTPQSGDELAVEDDLALNADPANRIPVEGVIAMEGVATGDGRMIETGALDWEGVLPVAIIWDREDGDHTGATVGAIETIERRDGGEIWGAGWLSASSDAETAAAVTRVKELLDEQAVGVSIRFDTQSAEVRVKKEVLDMDEDGLPDGAEEDEDGRVVVWRVAPDDVLEVTTHGRIRHLAIVDTAAFAEASIAVAASGSLKKADWSGRESWFADPKFGVPGQDDRLRYDPGRGAWSCPVTVLDDGRVFGHIAPMGICLRGRSDRCVTPPNANLEAFMRGQAPAAGGARTGVICVGGGHADVGVGAAEATRFYDNTGRAVADVRVGRDAYGVWFAGMLRPGANDEDVYAFKSSDVSGHWEQNQQGAMELCGLPAVNVGGFPKGYLTYEEVSSGLVAAADLAEHDHAADACECGGTCGGCGTVPGEAQSVHTDRPDLANQIRANAVDTSTIRDGAVDLRPEKLPLDAEQLAPILDAIAELASKVDSTQSAVGKLYAAHLMESMSALATDDTDDEPVVDSDTDT